MHEAQGAQRVEPGVNSPPQDRTRWRLTRGARERREHAKVTQYPLNKLGELWQPKRDGALQRGNVCALCKRGQHLEYRRQSQEDARGVEQKLFTAAQFLRNLTGAPPGSKRYALEGACSNPDRRQRRTTQRPNFGELIQEMKILGRLALRNTAHTQICRRSHAQRTANALISVTRSCCCKTEHIVAK